VTVSRVGFIGLGTMGRPMAGHILAGGHALSTYTRRAPPPELVAAGAVPCASSQEVAARSDVVITMLPDTPDVAAVLFGDGGVAAGLTPGKLVIDMSTVSPTETKRFAARVEALGCGYLDAPVSGGDVGAKAGTLSIMVGGRAETFAAALPLLRLMGKTVTHVGQSGDGQTCKVANQIVVAATIEAVAEALLFASKAGADPARVRQALMGGFAGSRILEVHGERMLARNFEPGFRVELQRKDLALALDGARELALSLPATATCQQLLNACCANGGAKWDHSGVVRVLEALADHTLAGGEP
jgi:2-hydroxy-3-oxopropionate reductase